MYKIYTVSMKKSSRLSQMHSVDYFASALALRAPLDEADQARIQRGGGAHAHPFSR